MKKANPESVVEKYLVKKVADAHAKKASQTKGKVNG